MLSAFSYEKIKARFISRGVSERLPRHRRAPDGKNGRVTFTVPARKQCQHIWSLWAGVTKSLKAALAGQYRQAITSPSSASALL